MQSMWVHAVMLSATSMSTVVEAHCRRPRYCVEVVTEDAARLFELYAGVTYE